MNKNLRLIVYLLVTALALLSVTYAYRYYAKRSNPIKVGILHSLSGTMAISEKPLQEATLMAIDEINAKGGLLGGRLIEPVIVDIKSDWDYAAKMTKKLIVEDKVSVIFGCWTSSCRKTIKSVIEEHDHLLFYPLQYEGLEQSKNIVYTGAAPNQQIIPAIKWAYDHLGKRFFLVGSDYVFPRTANAIIKDQVSGLGGEIVGEKYILLGSQDVGAAVDKILESKPDVILNSINGDSNIAFFKKLRENGILSTSIPTISFSIGETELQSMDVNLVKGDYAVWSYFQSIPSERNQQFVNAFKAKYGKDRVVNDPMEAGYFGVYLWSQAVTDARSDRVEQTKNHIKKQSFKAPEGLVYVDPENQHTWKSVRVGQIQEDGQFTVVWDSLKAVRPIPFPSYRSKDAWNRFLNDIFISYGNSWAKSADKAEEIEKKE